MAADLYRGAIVRDCLVKNVVDGKTLKVTKPKTLLTPAEILTP
jgi:hypothetical protein